MTSARWSLDEDLAFYDRAGISQVGLSFDKLLAAAGHDLDGVEHAARRVAAAGVRVTNMLGLGVFALGAPATWGPQGERLLAAVETGVLVGAECLVALTGPAGPMRWEEAADTLASAAGPFLGAARAAGVAVALEHTNSLRMDVSFLHTLRDTVDLAGRMDLGVCLDISACWGERALADTLAAGAASLLLVQVSDWTVGARCTPDRVVPGDGDIPLHRFLRDVAGAGYDGVFDVEVLGPRVEDMGYTDVITRSVAWLDRALDDVGIAR